MTLTTVPPARIATPAEGDPPLFASVQLPGVVDRRPLVVRTGPETVEIREGEQWAEPLEGMVARILAQDLAMRTPPAQPSGKGDTTKVVVIIDEFLANTQGLARLSGWWRSDGVGKAQVVHHRFAMKTSFADGDDVQMVAALSRLLGTLADEIATLQ